MAAFPLDKVMAKNKTRGEELGAIGKQTMAHGYSAMDYYFDHLKKTEPIWRGSIERRFMGTRTSSITSAIWRANFCDCSVWD